MNGEVNGRIGWHTVTFMVGIAGSLMWLGYQANQISVNTGKLDKMELAVVMGYQRDADALAKIGSLERDVEQLKNWQQAVRRGEVK